MLFREPCLTIHKTNNENYAVEWLRLAAVPKMDTLPQAPASQAMRKFDSGLLTLKGPKQ